MAMVRAKYLTQRARGCSFPHSAAKAAAEQPPTPVSSHGSFRNRDATSPLSEQLSVGGTSAPSGSISTLLANMQGVLAEYDDGKTGELSRQLHSGQ